MCKINIVVSYLLIVVFDRSVGIMSSPSLLLSCSDPKWEEGVSRNTEQVITGTCLHAFDIACKTIPVITLCVKKTDEVITGINCTSGSKRMYNVYW